MHKNVQKIIGVTSLFLAITIFSTLEIACKGLRDVTLSIPAHDLVILRFLITGIVLGGLGYLHFHASGKRLVTKDWGHFLVNGVVCVTLSIWLYHMAVNTFENASSAAVVFSANALYAVIFARFMNNEAWCWSKWVALFIGMIGIGFFVFETGKPTLNALKAIGIMSLSSLTFAFSVCYTKRVVPYYGAAFFMGMSSLMGCLVILPFVIIGFNPAFLQGCLDAWPQLAYLALAGTLLAYLLYYEGLKSVSVFLGSISFMLKPVLACIFASLWRHDKMNSWTVCGMIVIVLAVAIAVISSNRNVKSN